jgi:hypothetical protein
MDPAVKRYLLEIASNGGSANTQAQNAARRKNGKNGGRPKGSKDSKPRTRSPNKSKGKA